MVTVYGHLTDRKMAKFDAIRWCHARRHNIAEVIQLRELTFRCSGRGVDMLIQTEGKVLFALAIPTFEDYAIWECYYRVDNLTLNFLSLDQILIDFPKGECLCPNSAFVR